MKEKIIEKLKEIIDPELGYDIVSLGEIDEIKVENNNVKIKFIPTTPLCPFLPFIYFSIKEKIEKMGYNVEIEIDFNKKWDVNRVDPEIRRKLNFMSNF